ncbi:MAG TPA: NADP-dependent phosphogluconate dehydrogenase [Terriglobia bacterium]|nr:NADP-dependent phosphogluconate dehydrogenase [Terriglobia bacterium]
MGQQHLGVIGLGVMGRNLALNAENKGFPAAGFDVSPDKLNEMSAAASGKNVVVAKTLKEFTDALERPRRLLAMVPAGAPVDSVLHDLKPYLDKDDIVIDGGNSYYKDTERRAQELDAAGLRFFGMGVSGGEEGALHGPSLMPGGHEESYRHLEPLLTKMAAQTADGACCAYMGPGGAGHYVKMVHNGIEYGIEQIICEAYDILKNALGLRTPELRDIFAAWAGSALNSFLLEITALVLGKIDPDTGKPLVEMILDEAAQKGTGKWTAQDALDLGVAVPTISYSVEARIISSRKDERVAAAAILRGPSGKFSGDRKQFIEQVRQAYQIAVICCYAQGFDQLRSASAEHKYNLNLPEIARIWKGGCIIRAKMLDPIQAALLSQPDLKNLMLDPYFSRIINETSGNLREVVTTAMDLGTPCAAFATTLGYIDSYRHSRLPANLLQGLRDCFGAHTYRRVDKPGSFHTEWSK